MAKRKVLLYVALGLLAVGGVLILGSYVLTEVTGSGGGSGDSQNADEARAGRETAERTVHELLEKAKQAQGFEGPQDSEEPEAPDEPRAVRYVELQGHRGARGLYPENSLEGFAESLAIGVSTLELDVGLTKDGVVVVHHDLRLNPSTTRDANGQWLGENPPTIRSLNFAELEGYDIGMLNPESPYAARFPEQQVGESVRIPKLADVIETCDTQSHETISYNIETKLNPEAPQDTATPVEMADAVLQVIREAGIMHRSTLQSFDFRTLARVQEVAPEMRTVCLTDDATIRPEGRGPSPWTNGLTIGAHRGSVPRLVKAAGCLVWSPNHEGLTTEAIEEAHQLRLRVVVWTVNSEARMHEVIDMGVDGIISDYPDRARRVFEAKEVLLPLPHRRRPPQ